MAFLTNFSDTWKQLVELVIRPPRFQYDAGRDLGPRRFQFRGRHIIREDLELINPRGFVLKCSHYIPLDPEVRLPHDGGDASQGKRQKPKPCVIYCHGNAGSRVDAAMMLHGLLPHNISVFAFDFSGAGQSEGKYLSLGFYEKGDLATVVNHLRESGKVSRIGLWGHSMGAATCLLYAAGGGDAFISAMVLDSAFSSLEQIMTEVAANAKKKLAFDGLMAAVPDFFISMALTFMRKSIQSQANFDIKEVHPLSKVPRILLPAVFAHGVKDEICAPEHVDLLYEHYAGDKTLFKFDGDHNSPRPEAFHELVSSFFVATLQGNRGDVFLYRTPSTMSRGADRADAGFQQESFRGKGFSSGSETGDSREVGSKMSCFHTGRSAQTLSLLVSLCPCCTSKQAASSAQAAARSQPKAARASRPQDTPSRGAESSDLPDSTTPVRDSAGGPSLEAEAISERRAAKLAELDQLKREMRSMEAELDARAQRRQLQQLRQEQEQRTTGNGAHGLLDAVRSQAGLAETTLQRTHDQILAEERRQEEEFVAEGTPTPQRDYV